MGWRTGNLPMGWGWLEPVLIGVTLLIALRAAAAFVRVRVPRSGRRSRLPAPLRTAISWLSLTLSLSASPAMASARFQAPPSRSGRPLPEAPWSGTSGFLPPHPLVPPGSETLGTPAIHPAIHGDAHFSDDLPRLFERAGELSGGEQKESGGSKRFHPAGSPQPVFVTRKPTISVNRGDCLWGIAAEVLATDDPARIDRYWKRIFAANRSVIGTDPNKLFPGQILELPRETSE